ncbi:PDR/VanB family oxidoreductase [Amycolatopsis thermoflava]|uniref:PDR/VanB family oxidoreductase n=1 Tax=Amycolatopsis thermoflava TaxID=84480 RepID=UPI00042A5B98|nr:PDR/VanB family oxidoreductase [Amycolatopsis thermoflava]
MTTGAAPVNSAGDSRELVVAAETWEAEGVITLVFRDPEGADLPPWTAGAHLDLHLPSGRVRQYSLCGDPGNRKEYRIAVLREADGRGGSAEIHDLPLVGRRLTIRGPRNQFELVPSSRYLFIAGGIGVTPILSMISVLSDDVDWRLHYGGRSRKSMAFVDEIEAIGGPRVQIVPEDEHGLLDVRSIVASTDPSTVIYCCGPQGLIGAVEEARDRLRPEVPLHIERFAASSTAVELRRRQEADDRSFVVELRRSRATLDVPPGRSVLDAIRDVLPGAPSSCEEGYCGSCEVAVLDGVPDHRDEILTEDERRSGRTMFPCVSRAVSDRLVLDL